MNEFRKALIDGNVVRCWQLSKHVAPNMPQPKTRSQAEVIMHITRTEMNTIPEPLRLESHEWLIERALPSRLPYDLAPKREAHAVAVMVGTFTNTDEARARAAELLAAQTEAVRNAQANGVTDPAEMRRIIKET